MNNIRQITAAAAIGALVAALAVAQPAPQAPARTVASTVVASAPAVSEVGGTIRWVNRSKWMVLDDATHTPYGVSRVELRADRVRIHFTFRATEVRDFDTSVDESFASVNVRVGASVGLAYADVFFYMGTNPKPVNPGLLSKAGANVWFSGSFITP